MNLLTVAICCFGLSGFFAWVSGAAFSSALDARSRATYAGALSMLRQPVPDAGLMDFTISVSAVVLVIGIAFLIASMLPPSQPQDFGTRCDKSAPRETRQRAEERMRRWAEEDRAALAAGKRKPLAEMPRLVTKKDHP